MLRYFKGLFPRYILLPILVITMLLLGSIVIISRDYRNEFTNLSSHYSILLKNNLIQKDKETAALIAGRFRDEILAPLAKNDLSLLRYKVDSLLKGLSMIDEFIVFNSTGQIISRWKQGKSTSAESSSKQPIILPPDRVIRYGDNSMDIIQAILDDDRMIGGMQITMAMDGPSRFQQQVDGYLEGVTRALGTRMIVKSAIFFASIVLFLIFLGIIVNRTITRPLTRLQSAIQEISSGNLSMDIPGSGTGEIAELSKKFKEMVERLKRYQEEIRTHQEDLEAQVERRTNQLAEKNRELNTTLDELKKTQIHLIHAEKMASLGQLVAGIAHELNNPVNFISGNIGYLKTLLKDLGTIMTSFDRIVPERLEDRQRLLEEKKRLGYEQIIADLEPIMQGINEGARRIQKLTLELRRFSRLDEAVIKDVDLTEGIDSAIAMLDHRIHDRIAIKRDYRARPQTFCFPSQLNQVFMHVISNAVEAITGRGSIFIDADLVDGQAVIQFRDDGCGIDRQILPKVFDPFFSTKPAGKRQGIGLSIAYSVIERHRGSIKIESEKGKGTTATIILPIVEKMEKFEEMVGIRTSLLK